jgi:hypothetical protein
LTTLVGGAFGFTAASAFAFAAAAAVAAAALSFVADVFIDFFSAATCAGVLDTFGLDVNLSINIFVPAPRAAPVSAFTTLLDVELDGLVADVNVCFGAPVVFVVKDGLVPVDVLLVIEGLEDVPVPVPVPKLVVNEGLEPPVDVIELELPLLTFGALLAPLITLLSGARVSAFASGICLLDVRFFRIAIFYPVFFTSDVNVAMSVIGLSFVLLAKVFAGATRVFGLTC